MNIGEIPLDAIEVSNLNTRKDLSAGTEDGNIDDLADSIREQGILNPVIVRETPSGRYELIAGQRRLIACRRLGLPTIPATIRNDLGDTEATVVSIIENVHRADMNPMDKARAYEAIRSRYGDERQVANKTGVTLPTIRRYLSMLNLAPEIQEEITTSEGFAGVGTLSKLAEIFRQEDQGRALEALRGLRQDIQFRILKESGGNFDKLLELKEREVERIFNAQWCEEGLCFKMPLEWKQRIEEGLASDTAIELPPILGS